jgi:hypothetical protein
MRKFTVIVGTCAILTMGAAEAAKPAPSGNPAQVQKLMACRAIAAADERLACFDRETAAVDKAIASRELVFVDREKARAAGRSLFGFSIPNFGGIFGGGDEDEIKQIDGTVTKFGHNQDGGWVFFLADGSIWSQTDDWPLGLPPRAGDKVVISRGIMGSFRLRLNKQPEIKVKRIG